MFKAALVGNGYIGGVHRNGYRILKEEGSDITLVAVCDVREEKLEDVDGAKTYTNIDDLIANEKDLDLIDLAVPTYLHCELAIKCMEAGFNVMVEKPMALTEEECDKMLECAKRTGKKFMVAHCCRFAAPMEIFRRFIQEQKFGKPVSAFFTSTGARPDWGFENWFRDAKRSGGCMLDLQAHNIDLMNWYFGMPKYVSTVAIERHEGEGYESISANHIYENGLYVHSWCDWGFPVNYHAVRSMRVNFENGYIYNERASERNTLVAVDNDGTVTDLTDTVVMNNSTARNEIEYFANCIKTNQIPRMNKPEESKKAVRIIRAQEASAKMNGAPVEIKED